MSKKQFFISILAVALAVMALDYLYLHILFPDKKAQLVADMTELLNRKAPPSRKTSPPNEKRESNDISADLSSQIEKCFDNTIWNEISPFVLSASTVQTDAVTVTVHMENWHYLGKDNEEKRVQKTSDGLIRLFKLDSEGLPVPLELSDMEKFKAISELVEFGNIKKYQINKTVQSTDGSFATATLDNGEISELEIISGAKAFSCSQKNCNCR